LFFSFFDDDEDRIEDKASQSTAIPYIEVESSSLHNSSETMTETCDVWEQTWNALTSEESTPTKNCAYACLAVVATTFVVSSLTGNYSQVDKIWSIVPLIYCWIVLCDERTLLMAIVATVWGIRLTWNFSRRGGYTWPPWNGDEDYRWKYLQDGFLLSILQNKSAVSVFLHGMSLLTSLLSKLGLTLSLPFTVDRFQLSLRFALSKYLVVLNCGTFCCGAYCSDLLWTRGTTEHLRFTGYCDGSHVCGHYDAGG
jgi:hypothetical protein